MQFKMMINRRALKSNVETLIKTPLSSSYVQWKTGRESLIYAYECTETKWSRRDKKGVNQYLLRSDTQCFIWLQCLLSYNI